ncbi:MAG: nucleotidyltransferase domain-containing protein [bacterium]
MVDSSIIETARKYTSLIPDYLLLKKAYLFGSHSTGTAREDSDIDIALIIGNMGNFNETQMQLMRLRRAIDLRIEPHPISVDDFNELNPFVYELKRTGIEL